jgi:hypothetical protein
MLTLSKTPNNEISLSTSPQVNAAPIQRIKVLFDQILIDYKILKNYSNKNDTKSLSTILLNQIEQLKTFLLQFSGGSKPKASGGTNTNRFRNSSDPVNLAPLTSIENQARVQSNDEIEFIQKNNQVKYMGSFLKYKSFKNYFL